MKDAQCRIPIMAVKDGSIAQELDIQPGDFLLSIDGRCPKDIIDFRFMEAEEELLLLIESHGELIEMEIEKEISEDIGIIFDFQAFSPIHPCENRCIFCFVDQLPRGMRSSLYIKDDDYRYSVVSGNFITLTNLTEKDRSRIIEEKLSPLYISVHAIDPAVRSAMMGNDQAGRILTDLQSFAAAKLTIHAQIVLCPGWNDGAVLDDTLQKLAALYPAVQSIGVVPVGLTGFRQGLPELTAVDSAKAEEIIQQIDGWRQIFINELDNPLVYAADEFYSLAGRDIPKREYYGEFLQTENGIGLMRLLLDRWDEEKVMLPKRCAPLRILVINGKSSSRYVQRIIQDLNTIPGLTAELAVVGNHFFGGGITVTGLITGQDLLDDLKEKDRPDAVLLPDSMLQEDNDRFLDGMELSDLAECLQTQLIKVDSLGNGLADVIRNLCKQEGC